MSLTRSILDLYYKIAKSNSQYFSGIQRRALYFRRGSKLDDKSMWSKERNRASTAIAEDDDLRSRYMQRLICEADTYMHQSAASALPRVLVHFWDDSKAIPADVHECIDSWRPLDEQGFKRFLFDDDSAGRFITE